MVLSVPFGVIQTVVAKRTAALRASGQGGEIGGLAAGTIKGLTPLAWISAVGETGPLPFGFFFKDPVGSDEHGNIVVLIDNVRDDNFYDFNNTQGFSYIAGFFSSQLNTLFDRNIMTIDAFDWLHRTGANPPHEPVPGNNCTSAPARPFLYEGVFAHEYQHLLEFYADESGESTWVNEGLSDHAQTITGYVNPATPITSSTLTLTARIPSGMTIGSPPPAPFSASFDVRSGSFVVTGMIRPRPTTSWALAAYPGGMFPAGHSTSLTSDGLSTEPTGRLRAATAI